MSTVSMVEKRINWYKFPEFQPEKLPSGQYKKYLVAFNNGYVMECSWLFNQFCERHDGCSDRTEQVRWWAEKPIAPDAKY